MKIESPRTVISSTEDKTTKSDNSNPQQGSENMVPQATSDDKLPLRSSVEHTVVKHGNRTTTMKSPPTKKDSRKLFVGGLPSDITDQEFREFFEQFGEIVDSVVMYDRETRRSRGFGFVTFQDPEIADHLLSKDEVADDTAPKPVSDTKNSDVRVGRLVMRGKTCEVKAAEPKEAKSNRRTYQNQAVHADGIDREFMNKLYNPEDRLLGGAPPTGFDAHMQHGMAGQYPLGTLPMGYYPPQHPGIHGGYMQPVYAPIQTMHNSQDDGNMFPSVVATHMDGNSGYYVNGNHGGMHPHPYYQPQYMHPAYAAHQTVQNTAQNGRSAMQRTAPGIPAKGDNVQQQGNSQSAWNANAESKNEL